MKYCFKCKNLLEDSMFYKNKDTKDGLQNVCKECKKLYLQSKEKRKIYRDNNLEKIREKDKEYSKINKEKRKLYKDQHYRDNKEYYLKQNNQYYSDHKELILEKQMINYNNNKDIFKQKNRKYYLNHSEQIKKQTKIYRLVNKLKVSEYFKNLSKKSHRKLSKKIYNHKRRQLIKGSSFSVEDWKEILQKFNFKCAYCHSNNNLSIEHVIPISKGGLTVVNNIIPACLRCNCSKNNTLLELWYPNQICFDKDRLEIIRNHQLSHVNSLLEVM